MDLVAVMNDRAAASCQYMNQTLNFKYRPAMITVESVGKLQSESSIEELSSFFAGALVWWDLTEPDTSDETHSGARKMVEINEDIFKKLPAALVRAIAQTLLHDAPKREEGNGFSGS